MSRLQRGPVLPSVVMVVLATAATGLLAVVGLQALPDTVVQTTFHPKDDQTRHVDVSDSPSVRPAAKPVPTSVAPASTEEPRSGHSRTSSRTRTNGPVVAPPPHTSTAAAQQTPTSTKTTAKPSPTKSPSPSPSPTPTCSNPHKKCTKPHGLTGYSSSSTQDAPATTEPGHRGKGRGKHLER